MREPSDQPDVQRYCCVTCAGLAVTPTSALQHIAEAHTVVNRDGARQSMSEHARQPLVLSRQRTA
jgi:putative SOS response-associated peptidase YedK